MDVSHAEVHSFHQDSSINNGNELRVNDIAIRRLVREFSPQNQNTLKKFARIATIVDRSSRGSLTPKALGKIDQNYETAHTHASAVSIKGLEREQPGLSSVQILFALGRDTIIYHNNKGFLRVTEKGPHPIPLDPRELVDIADRQGNSLEDSLATAHLANSDNPIFERIARESISDIKRQLVEDARDVILRMEEPELLPTFFAKTYSRILGSIIKELEGTAHAYFEEGKKGKEEYLRKKKVVSIKVKTLAELTPSELVASRKSVEVLTKPLTNRARIIAEKTGINPDSLNNRIAEAIKIP